LHIYKNRKLKGGGVQDPQFFAKTQVVSITGNSTGVHVTMIMDHCRMELWVRELGTTEVPIHFKFECK